MTRTANLKDLLEKLFSCSSPVALSSETSLFLFPKLARSKLSRSLCLHSYFISNSIFFFYKSDTISSRWHRWFVTYWHFNDKLIAGGRIGSIKGTSPGSATLYPPQTTSRLASLANCFFFSTHPDFFPLSPAMRSLVPEYLTFRGDSFSALK